MNNTPERAVALKFLKEHDAGVIASVSKEWHPHASAIYYVADDHFNIYFVTKIDSRKYAAIAAHPQVAFTVGSLALPQTIQIEGMAAELKSDIDKKEHVPQIMDELSKKDPFYLPLAKMDSEVVIMWIKPTWIRWGDFSNEASGNKNVFTEIPVR